MGFSTTKWGPPAWDFLFIAALNHHFNKTQNVDEKYIAFFENLSFVLPCSFCVDYYSMLIKKYPVQKFLEHCKTNAIDFALFRWLYFIKDKVNAKLIKQETVCLEREINRIDALHLSTQEKIKLVKANMQHILYTQETPDFQVVFDKYIAYKSDCSTETNQVLKSCRHLPSFAHF